MIKTEDWDALYYVIIRQGKGIIDIVGLGSTKMICRNSAMDDKILKTNHGATAFLRMIENIDIGKTMVTRKNFVYTMAYCEAKVYIYGKRYGYTKMDVILDPTFEEPLVRFSGFRYRNKTKIEGFQWKTKNTE